MTNMSFEDSEILKELRRQERFWRVARWLAPVFCLWILLDKNTFNDPDIIRFMFFIGLTSHILITWNGDPKSKLLIRLCEDRFGRNPEEKIISEQKQE